MRHFKRITGILNQNGIFWVLILLISLSTAYLCLLYGIFKLAFVSSIIVFIAAIQLIRKRYIVYPQKRDALAALMLVNKSRTKSIEFRKDVHENFWILRLTAFEIIGKDELVESYLGIIDDRAMTWKNQQQAVLGVQDTPSTIIFDQYPLSFTATINLCYKLAAIQNNAINKHSIYNAKTLVPLLEQASDFDIAISKYQLYQYARKVFEFLGIINYKRKAADEKMGNINGARVKIEE